MPNKTCTSNVRYIHGFSYIAFFSILAQNQFFLKKFTIALLACVLAGNLHAQNIRMKEHRILPVFQRFESAADLRSPEECLSYLHKTYQLGNDMTFRHLRTDKDNMGMEHIRYAQWCHGRVVEGAVLILHVRNNQVISCNGDLFPVNNPATVPALTESAALTKALDVFQATEYAWDHNAFNKKQERTLPKGELVWAPEKGNATKGNFSLAWKFDIYALKPLRRACVYVDAVDGHIIWEQNKLMDMHSRGTAYTKYSSMRQMVTDSTAPNYFQLFDETRGTGIHTLDMQNSTSDSYDFINTTNTWTDTAGTRGAEYDVHWGLQRIYDYYDSTHGRNSFDNLGSEIDGYVHFDVNFANAFWDGQEIVFGDGDLSVGMRPLTSLDIIGHEFTHAVTQYSANLNYEYESGALNESFSDIFGKTIEKKYKPSTFTWYIGKEIFNDGSIMRNMSNPRTGQAPDTYGGTYWYTGTDDEGGVHTNSNVQNYWYYILTTGKTGTNDLNHSYSVTGIGFDKAAAIVYRSLTNYLTPFSEYSDARMYSIEAAEDLFGKCSNEVIQTTNAWYAVGVGNKFPSANVVTASANALPASVAAREYVQLQSTSTHATSVQWFTDGALTSSKVSDSCKFSTTGSHQIVLVAANSMCTDTLKRSIQVTPGLAIPRIGAQPAFSVYPNPASGYFVLEGNSSNNGIQYILTDVSGKAVISNHASGKAYKEYVSVRQLPSGIYTLTVRDGEQTNAVQIVIRN